MLLGDREAGSWRSPSPSVCPASLNRQGAVEPADRQGGSAADLKRGHWSSWQLSISPPEPDDQTHDHDGAQSTDRSKDGPAFGIESPSRASQTGRNGSQENQSVPVKTWAPMSRRRSVRRKDVCARSICLASLNDQAQVSTFQCPSRSSRIQVESMLPPLPSRRTVARCSVRPITVTDRIPIRSPFSYPVAAESRSTSSP